MIEFLLGRACTGKTFEIVKRAAAVSRESKTILIVPEQFTFETERAIVKMSEANQENISVYSFSRLFDAVLSYCGFGYANCITDFEKIIILKKAILSCSDELKVFSRYTKHKDFIKTLSETINDIKLSSYCSGDLNRVADEIGGVCGAKLHDISLVMSTYDAIISNKFIDTTDRLTKLYNLLADSDYFKDTVVLFDSFTGFTGQQYAIIERIIDKAKDVIFSFCTDIPSDNTLGVFYNINCSVNKICSIARSRGESNIVFTELSKNYYSNEAMSALEKFMSGREVKYLASDNNIRVLSCKNLREEAVAAANIIRREVAENEYRYKDFIVVSRDAETYKNHLMRQCEANDIACFMDKSEPLLSTPISLYVQYLLEIAKASTTENILKLLKLHLNEFSDNEISELENYTYIWDIKASDWNNRWELSVNGLQTEEDNQYDAERLNNINITREKIINMINKFKKSYVGAPKNRATAIYVHLTEQHIDKALSKLCDYFENDGNFAYSSLLKQAWDSVIGVLDSMVRALDECDITSDDFLDSYILAAEVALISNTPQMLDEVSFGSADRIRPSKPKIAIILGCNQGVFPKITGQGGILGNRDIEKLAKHGIVIDDHIKGAVEENYLVYSMLCCAVDKVYLLYSSNSFNGDRLEHSSFVKQILDRFDDINIEQFSLASSGQFKPLTAKSAFKEIGSVDSSSFIDIIRSLESIELYSERLKKITNTTVSSDFIISGETAKRLFGSQISLSATKFETYHKCSLSYLLKNGFKIQKLRKSDLNVLQRGTIVHFVLEYIVNKYKSELSKLSKTQISAEVDLLIHQYIASVKGSEMIMSARFAFLLDKISASIKEIVYHISEEFAQSGFRPEFCELKIGKNGDIPQIEYTLSDGSVFCLEGKIDRVDVYKNFVRVVDYKTGKMTFTLSDTLVGLNMQMLLYLYAFIKNGNCLVENPRPAGILYMPAKNAKDKKSLKMNGLITDSEDIAYAMEKQNEGAYVPKYSETAPEYVDEELFSLIFNKLDELITDMGENIINGKFYANPTDGLETTACSYCDFAAICRSRKKEHNSVIKLSNDEIKKILKGGDHSEL